MFVAITRAVSPTLAACELTHLERAPIDVDRARAQHRAYEQALADAGGRVQQLETSAAMPDSVFIEDIAVVFDELAVITRPGADSRRGEIAAVAAALEPFRPLHEIQSPGTLDGGDVLVVGHRVFVGVSTRTNEAAIAQLRQMLGPRGYTVCATKVTGCLHLKSAVTALDDSTLLVNRAWIEPAAFDGFALVDVDPAEPSAANALRLADRIIFPSAFPRTVRRIEARGLHVVTVDADELAKAEGAVTCCSVIIGE